MYTIVGEPAFPFLRTLGGEARQQIAARRTSASPSGNE
jgi:hypothetical protein